MSRSSVYVVCGFVLGALTVLAIQRFRELNKMERAEAVLDRVSKQIETLEQSAGIAENEGE